LSKLALKNMFLVYILTELTKTIVLIYVTQLQEDRMNTGPESNWTQHTFNKSPKVLGVLALSVSLKHKIADYSWLQIF